MDFAHPSRESKEMKYPPFDWSRNRFQGRPVLSRISITASNFGLMMSACFHMLHHSVDIPEEAHVAQLVYLVMADGLNL